MALYRLHKVEWEKQLRPATEAFKAKTGKRKRSDKEEGEVEEGVNKKAEFPGGGRKGVSSGLGLIVKKNGVRVESQTKRGGKGGKDNGDSGEAGGNGLNWWEEDAQ